MRRSRYLQSMASARTKLRCGVSILLCRTSEASVALIKTHVRESSVLSVARTGASGANDAVDGNEDDEEDDDDDDTAADAVALEASAASATRLFRNPAKHSNDRM